jgi:glycyl-tRNA synthetase
MVVEMTALQGIMGRYYALHSGEDAAVAEAIYEHYLPRSSGDTPPAGKAGLLLSVADRLDLLSGLFAAGLAPSGTKDPFAQRRSALGLVQALIGREVNFDLREGVRLAAEGLPLAATADQRAACVEFIAARLRAHLLEEGEGRYDVVDAVLAEQSANPLGAWRAVQELSAWIKRADWNTVLPAYSRCVRITRDQAERLPLTRSALSDPAEIALLDALEKAEAQPRAEGSVAGFFAAFVPLIPAINRFFEAVLVMAEEPAVRANRLGILQRVAALAAGVADFSKLEGF